jgi:NTP pyrophosphatase (non-canonical NTP hydrolase)
MNLTEYADWTGERWLSKKDPDGGVSERDRTICTMGLAGEVGEVMELLKKRIRDGNLDETALAKELGDVLYYWARLCRMYGLEPQTVLETNVNKIEDRRARGTMRGSGNDR